MKKPSKKDLTQYTVATFDIETDPFKAGRKPEPFCFGFYVGEQSVKRVVLNNTPDDVEFLEQWENLSSPERKACMNLYRSVKRRERKAKVESIEEVKESYADFWHKDPETVKEQFINHLESLDTPHLIFAHNGGKFDYMYFHKWIRGEVFVINGRLVEWEYITSKGVRHILRDSFTILPVALGTGGSKLDIDYRKMEKSKRNKHKEEILIYLKQDCVALYELCIAFKQKYGEWSLTLASASYNRVKEKYDLCTTNEFYDSEYRKFYFGGRCQSFEQGELKGEIVVFDVNSMYPFAMSAYNHPIGNDVYKGKEITDDTFFIHWKGKNKGALPVRLENGEIYFDLPEGEFFSSIHEYKVALKYNLIEVDEIINTHNWITHGNFKDHIDSCKADKENAVKGSKEYLLAKLDMNSSYGKFAQDPRKYKKNVFIDPDEFVTDPNCTVIEGDNFKLVSSPDDSIKKFNNVATAGSITGASRAILLEALVLFKRAGMQPFYTDTDSLIGTRPTSKVEGVNFHPSELGAWDEEKDGDTLYVAGKKIYALYKNNECVKIACKGVRVIPRDIYDYLPQNPTDNDVKIAKQKMLNIGGNLIKDVSLGGEFIFQNDAPSLKLDGSHDFIERKMVSTFKRPTLLENCK